MWSAEGTNLAVLRGDKPKGKAQRENTLLLWRDVGTPGMQPTVFDPGKNPAFPSGTVISEFTTPRFATDGALVVKALDGDKVYDVPRGTGASFSDNGRWVA